MKFTGTAGIYHVVINADFGVKSLTATATAGVWDIPNLYLVGSYKVGMLEQQNSSMLWKWQIRNDQADS
jgi:hypothetical protein